MIISAAVAAGLSGCAGLYSLPTVSQTATTQVMRAETGTVQSIRYVAVQDNSPVGTLLGAVAGAALGSTIGKGKGRILSSVAGGLAGTYVGNEVSKANAQELTIRLKNGRTIVVVRKGTQFYPGERVRVLYNGNQVGNVEPL
ncbi:glycine zipper 2TM domain-containing protein [Nitratifractor sp.]|uniref:glycine zipper 2TM domain-containing protein n=1 Tax=Nitratifractor sp. TaxID=2268144 RepID=UPI0025DA97B1|nr:glycine zipper 2TM domain-containing protein [Nitratifractor sp.]